MSDPIDLNSERRRRRALGRLVDVTPLDEIAAADLRGMLGIEGPSSQGARAAMSVFGPWQEGVKATVPKPAFDRAILRMREYEPPPGQEDSAQLIKQMIDEATKDFMRQALEAEARLPEPPEGYYWSADVQPVEWDAADRTPNVVRMTYAWTLRPIREVRFDED